ncbi:MAG: hypothetical protein F4Z15_12040 [Gammaproteobacteria bacterium]|nr:hypothetical protein [Gammaproteobacteria bacterium]
MNDAPMTKGDMQTILDHITSERQKTENYVHEELEKANNRMDAMQKGISNLRKDVSTLKSDVSILKSDVSTLKSDVSILKSDVSILKSDVSILKEGQARIDSNVTTIADELGILDKIKTA